MLTFTKETNFYTINSRFDVEKFVCYYNKQREGCYGIHATSGDD